MDIDKLKYHLENTPLEELRKEWAEVDEWKDVGPKAIDFRNFLNNKYVQKN